MSKPPAPIVIVTGPSGAGKTTVARLVAAEFDRSVHLQGDDFLFSIVSGSVDAWRPEAIQQNEAVGAAIAAAALQFAQCSYAVALDGTFFPDVVDGLAAWAARHGVPLHYAVLRSELSTCLTRVQQRRAGDPEDFDAWAQFHARFADIGQREANVIDASSPPKNVAAAVMDAFAAGRLRVS